MGRLKKVWGALAVLGAAMASAAQTKPEDAITNLTAWARFLGITGVAPSPSMDTAVTLAGLVLFLTTAVLWWKSSRTDPKGVAKTALPTPGPVYDHGPSKGLVEIDFGVSRVHRVHQNGSITVNFSWPNHIGLQEGVVEFVHTSRSWISFPKNVTFRGGHAPSLHDGMTTMKFATYDGGSRCWGERMGD